ncbi:MAG: hypothetical protein CMJ78_00050 [Planctomycetaceae bacterium]|nr:hypothetical protein [Planctomycetaceae bacterium]
MTELSLETQDPPFQESQQKPERTLPDKLLRTARKNNWGIDRLEDHRLYQSSVKQKVWYRIQCTQV